MRRHVRWFDAALHPKRLTIQKQIRKQPAPWPHFIFNVRLGAKTPHLTQCMLYTVHQACTTYGPRELFLRSATAFSIAENVAKAQHRTFNCRSRIPSKLQRNRLLRPAKNLRWSICTFEFSELYRPAVHYAFVRMQITAYSNTGKTCRKSLIYWRVHQS